ncbi:MAG: hypothetical protein LUF85_03520 [Bacteroides sp.]|nr:hypothetical protein [Bacteroides sp.]
MKEINHCNDIEKLAAEMGFLPFFRNEIPGFSIEEHTPSELWFSDEQEGPWEWKGPVLREGNCAYGKLFQKKAGFVSMEWFPELVNYRRSVYNLYDTPSESMDRQIYETVVEHESLLSKEIKALCGYKKPYKKRVCSLDSWESKEVKALYSRAKPKKEGYETVVTRLQMGTWLVVADFEYLYNKQGDPYGWGIARYATPEALFGKEKILSCSHHTPEESKQRLTEHLTRLLPQASPSRIEKMIG